jgi:hypothetical protein
LGVLGGEQARGLLGLLLARSKVTERTCYDWRCVTAVAGMASFRGARMSRTAQILSAVLVASIVAGCGTTTERPDAGPLVDAGFHFTAPSVGTATFGGALTGTFGATALGFSETTGFPLLDGGNSGPYVYFQITNALESAGPSWGCSFELFSTTELDPGSYTPANVNELDCVIIIYLPDGGTGEQWFANLEGGFEPNIFDLNLTSPGPARHSPPDWADPSATVSVYLAPSPGENDGGVVITATVAPPPCPTYCAPGPP